MVGQQAWGGAASMVGQRAWGGSEHGGGQRAWGGPASMGGKRAWGGSEHGGGSKHGVIAINACIADAGLNNDVQSKTSCTCCAKNTYSAHSLIRKVVSTIGRAKEEEGIRYQSHAALTPHGKPA